MNNLCPDDAIEILYRSDKQLSSARQDGMTIGQIDAMILGLALMVVGSSFDVFPKWLQKRALAAERDNETRKQAPSASRVDRLNRELRRLKGSRWDIYETFSRVRLWRLNLPSLALIMLLPLFAMQSLIGSETGIRLFGFSIQFIFPVLITMAFVIAFSTADDLRIDEGKIRLPASFLKRFYWRYGDLILCSVFFFLSMLMIRDLAPIFLFFWIILISWVMRSRASSLQITLLAIAGIGVAIVGVYILPHWLPYMPEFLRERLSVWYDPFTYTANSGQFIDSLWLMKHAGFFGHGLGLAPNASGLSQVKDDFVLSLILADTGLLGFSALFVSFGLIVIPVFGLGSFRPRTDPNEILYRMIPFELAMMFVIQLAIVSGVVTGLLPIMGIPLLFIGKGGSSLALFAFPDVGIMINCKREMA